MSSHTASSLLESQYERSGASTPCRTFGQPFKITVCSWFSSRCVCSCISVYLSLEMDRKSRALTGSRSVISALDCQADMLLTECRFDTFLCPCSTLRWGHTTEGLVSFPLAALVLQEVVSSESFRGVCDHCTRSLPCRRRKDGTSCMHARWTAFLFQFVLTSFYIG